MALLLTLILIGLLVGAMLSVVYWWTLSALAPWLKKFRLPKSNLALAAGSRVYAVEIGGTPNCVVGGTRLVTANLPITPLPTLGFMSPAVTPGRNTWAATEFIYTH